MLKTKRSAGETNKEGNDSWTFLFHPHTDRSTSIFTSQSYQHLTPRLVRRRVFDYLADGTRHWGDSIEASGADFFSKRVHLRQTP